MVLGMAETLQALMKRAYQRSSEIYVNELSDGTVELIWKRRLFKHLSEVHSLVASNVRTALKQLILIEDDVARVRTHGECCDCEDCCISRVDHERSTRR